MMRVLLYLLAVNYAWSASMQIVNRMADVAANNKVTNYLTSRDVDLNSELELVSIVDCTGSNDCSFLNNLFGTSFVSGKAGMQLDVIDNCAVIHSGYDSIYSTSFCGSKAIDFSCTLHASSVKSTICISLKAEELDFALQSYEQVFRRFIKYANQAYQSASPDHEPIELVVLVDESSDSGAVDGTNADSSHFVEQFLQNLWAESFDKNLFIKAIKVREVVVHPNNAMLLEQARRSWREILDVQHSGSRPHASTVANSLKDDSPNSGRSGVSGSSKIAPRKVVKVNMIGEKLGDLIAQAWEKVALEPTPILSPRDQEALYAVESSYSRCLEQAETGIRQWQTRVAKGRLVASFPSRVAALANAVNRDFERGVAGHTSPSLASERLQRVRMLREHIMTAAGRLYLQQLTVIEFHVLNSFRRELAKLISLDLSDEARKEEERVQLQRALDLFHAQADGLESADLDFQLTGQRDTELRATLETVLREFPESSLAKLEEVRRVERLAKSNKGAGAGSADASTGRGRKRKGLAKALGVSLSLVGMLRPPGYGNLQGFVGYATSLLGLPLDLLLGIQNDGDSPEIMGEDREYPILRLQPKIKFDIDLQ